MKKVVFATKNKGKIREINEIFKSENVEVVSMEEIGVNIDIEETGTTFEENAIIKAKELKKYCDEIVLADDSGLEIDALDKKPGVYSSRFMGEDTSYEVKNAKIIEMLKDVPYEKRTARFVSVIAAVLPNGDVITARGTIEGIIGYESKGENGFGYDPIFFVPELNKSTAELSLEEKNKISHRGNALRLMKKKLMEIGI